MLSTYRSPYSGVNRVNEILNTVDRLQGVYDRYSPHVKNAANTIYAAYKRYQRGKKRNRDEKSVSSLTPKRLDFGTNSSTMSRMSISSNSFSTTPYVSSHTWSDKNQDIVLKRKVKKVKMRKSMPMTLADLTCPPLILTGSYKPDPYNEIITPLTNAPADGYRPVPQNGQDIICLPHLSYEEFGRLYMKALNAPKAFRLANFGQYNNDGTMAATTNNLSSVVPSADSATAGTWPGPQDPPQNLARPESSNWYENPNYRLLLHYYVFNYTVTNQSELPLYFEFTELTPKQVIQDRWIQVPDSNGTILSSLELTSEHQDPISCAKRDLNRSNNYNSFDNDLSGFAITSYQYPTTEINSKDLRDRGVSLEQQQFKELHAKYNFVSKKIVCVNPGNKIDYACTINGFERTSDFAYATPRLNVTVPSYVLNNVTVPAQNTHFKLMPTWLKQTKFLMIRSWCSKHAVSSDTPTTSLAYASGKYLISCDFSIKCRAVPSRGTHIKHINLTNYQHVVTDPDLQTTGAPLDTFVSQQIVDPESNQRENVEAADTAL